MPKLLPYMILKDFLHEGLASEILSYAIQNEGKYIDSMVYDKGEAVVSASRISKTFQDLGEYEPVIREHILAKLPEINEALKIAAFEVSEVEIQLAAHGDGALFTTHIDTMVHERKQRPRVISAVYYMHTTPKQFSGGDLRMHPLPVGDEPAEPVDVSPDHNTLLVFPSFAPHEVLPVHAPGVPFGGWRFAVNCWIHRA